MILVHALEREEADGLKIAVCRAMGHSLTVTREEAAVTCPRCKRRASGLPRGRTPLKPRLVES